MRSSIGLAHPADLPSHGPSLIYIGYADLLRLPRTTPITQCGPIPTHRLSRSPTWSQRSFASDHCGSCRSGRRSTEAPLLRSSNSAIGSSLWLHSKGSSVSLRLSITQSVWYAVAPLARQVCDERGRLQL